MAVWPILEGYLGNGLVDVRSGGRWRFWSDVEVRGGLNVAVKLLVRLLPWLRSSSKVQMPVEPISCVVAVDGRLLAFDVMTCRALDLVLTAPEYTNLAQQPG